MAVEYEGCWLKFLLGFWGLTKCPLFLFPFKLRIHFESRVNHTPT